VKIISGGQTGVDRAALDAALAHGIECSGWCPAGRLDEFGRIPAHYPVQELPNARPEERTRQNVADADATIIFHCGELRGGTAHTLQCCGELNRPHLVIDAATTSAEQAGKLLNDFVKLHRIKTLNIAGPRQSEWLAGYDYTFAALAHSLQLQG